MKRMVYLDPGLRQYQSLTEFFPHEGSWVVSYEQNGLPGVWHQTVSVSEFLHREAVLVVGYEENGLPGPWPQTT